MHVQPPVICWFQEATYELRIVDTATHTQSLPTRADNYRGGVITTLSEAYDAGVDMNRAYDVVVVIDTLTGTRNATTHFSKCAGVLSEPI